MRIALLSGEWPSDTPSGGIGTYTLSHALALALEGHRVAVFAPFKAQETPPHPNIQLINIQSTEKNSIHTNVVLEFLKNHRSEPFDILESPDLWHLGVDIKKSLPLLPFVVRLHTPIYLVNRFQQLGNLREYIYNRIHLLLRGSKSPWHVEFGQGALEKAQACTADQITAPSRAIAERISIDWRINYSQIDIIPNSICLPDTVPIFEHRNRKDILFVSRLDRLKGVFEVMDAMPPIFRKHADASVHIVGLDGKDKGRSTSELLRSRWSQWPSQWTYHGQLSNQDAKAMMARCGVAVFPSRWESFGLACAEALALGTPVVAANSGGLGELITDGENGLLVPTKNAKRLSQAIQKLLENPELARTIGASATAKMRDYSYSRCARRSLEVYERTIARVRGGTKLEPQST